VHAAINTNAAKIALLRLVFCARIEPPHYRQQFIVILKKWPSISSFAQRKAIEPQETQ